MTISAVSFGNNPQTAPRATGKKKMDPVKKGALIAGGISIAGDGMSTMLASRVAKQHVTKVMKSAYGSMGKCAAIAAAGIALDVAIGAGIGKLVKNRQEKKAAKEEAATEPTNKLDQQG